MSTQLRTAFRIGDVSRRQHSSRRVAADITLRTAATTWVVVTVLGQLVLALTVASFYGLTAARGDWHQWNRLMTHGYTPDHPVGNLVVAIHLTAAAIILLSGALQLIPQFQRRAPLFHRWNGRVYIAMAFAVSIAGLYMMWFRGSPGDLSQHLGQSLLAVLIMLCAGMALRYALARDFKTHRRWALRLFLVVGSALFIRAGIFLSLMLNHGPFGFDPATFSGPFLTFISFGQYLVPLAVLELYLRTQERAGLLGRFAMAAGLFVLTIGLGAGIFAVSMSVFLPELKKAYDNRKSVVDTLSSTIANNGVDQAVSQYRQLKAAAPSAYNFDEDELDDLGYELLHANKFKQAIRIFQLNVEAYPQSANTYDSLGEAYMDDGDKSQAIAHYEESLRLNPKNGNAVKMLRKLNAR